MKKSRIVVGLIAAGIFLALTLWLISQGAPVGPGRRDVEQVLAVWMCPPGRPYIKPESGAEYAAAWPTAAILCQSAWQRENQPIANDATLFLVSGSDFNQKAPLKNILAHTRYAIPVGSGARANWVGFANEPEQLFLVLAYPCGGSAGNVVRVYYRDVWYFGEELELQNHFFGEVLRDITVEARIGDMDKDGARELLIAEEDFDKPKRAVGRYHVFKWIECEMKEIAVVSPEVVQARRDELTSLW